MHKRTLAFLFLHPLGPHVPWGNFWVSSPQLMMNSASSISSRNDLVLNRNVGFLFAQ